MEGERASTTEMRESGRMCCNCNILIPLDGWPGGRRYCHICGRPKSVWLRFKYIYTVWEVEFLDDKNWMTVGRKRRFDHADSIRDMVARTPTRLDLAARQALDSALQNGEGGIKLELTGEQYAKLRKKA